MATACVLVGIYSRVSYCVSNESFCTIGAIPHASMANGSAIRGLWSSSSEDKCESTKVVPDSTSARSGGMSGMELV